MEKEKDGLGVERERDEDRAEDGKRHVEKEEGEEERAEESLSKRPTSSESMGETAVNGEQKPATKPSSIPSDFRCPLSMELMSDPVIVASGQTYERAHIQKWLDEGNTTCPKTRQNLSHTNLIPNYTVKALITNWCEANNVPLPDSAKNDTPVNGRTDERIDAAITIRERHQERSMSGIGSRPQASSRRTGLHKSEERQFEGNGYHRKEEEQQQSETLQSAAGANSAASRTSSARHSDGDSTMWRISSSKEKYEAAYSGHDSSSSTASQHHRTGSGSGSSAASSVEDVPRTSPPPNGSSSSERAILESSPYQSDVSSEMERLSLPSAAAGAVDEAAASPSRPSERPASTPRRRRQEDRDTSLPRIVPTPSQDNLGTADGNAQLMVDGLVQDLQSDEVDVQRQAAGELRLLAKYNTENRITIANCGAIKPLVALLNSPDSKTQENAVTALLNLSINDNNKSEIAAAGAIDPLVNVLKVGNAQSMENAAATLFSLSVMDENKVTIGGSGAIPPLVHLLINGSPRGKKDAATALFNLSIWHENKARIVRAGAIKPLVELMADPAAGMVDKAVAVLANLATIPEGRVAVGEEGGIPALVEVVEAGSQRGKENAAAALLQLCTNSHKHRALVLQEGAIPPLVALSQSGTARAKEKASALLRHFREQRHQVLGPRPVPDKSHMNQYYIN